MESIFYIEDLTPSTNPDNILKALARANCQNRVDMVNFNQYGTKDDIGLTAVSDIFCDSFILKTKNDEENPQLEKIRSLLNTYQMPEAGILTIGDNKFKISCSDYNVPQVLDFIKGCENEYELNCIDITRDFAGSFDKEEVVKHLINNHKFVEESFISKSNPTIIKNIKSPHTCLQFYKNKNLRCKIYLKMPEILQSRSVRSDVGNRWTEWAYIENNRLSSSRNLSSSRGLTRIEVTLYLDGNQFGYDIIELESYVADIQRLMAKELVFSTPHSAMWRAYCDCLKHTLIISNPQADVSSEHITNKKKVVPGRALVVYSFNNITKDISGRFVDNWDVISKHVIDRHTLSSLLPIDIIEVCKLRKITSQKGNIGIEVHATRNRYQKLGDRPLYLTKAFTIFNATYYTTSENERLLSQAGFIQHENCAVTLPLRKYCKTSKVECSIRLLQPEENINHNLVSHKTNIAKVSINNLKLTDLQLGDYNVYKIETRKSKYGLFILFIDYEGSVSSVVSNKILDDIIPPNGIPENADNSPVAQLRIIQKKRNHNRNLIINAELVI